MEIYEESKPLCSFESMGISIGVKFLMKFPSLTLNTSINLPIKMSLFPPPHIPNC